MSTVLHLNASIFSDQGQSSQLAQQFIDHWLAKHPGSRVIKRDLSAHPLPHLDAARFAALSSKPESRTPAQENVVRESDALVHELQAADVVVLGLPMYNFSIPSQLKSYFDHVARAGVTFRYTENGPEGLLKNKRAVVIATRGGLYAGTPADTQTGLVKTFLGFIGITNVKFVYAEGIAMGDAQKEKALASAKEELLASPLEA